MDTHRIVVAVTGAGGTRLAGSVLSRLIDEVDIAAPPVAETLNAPLSTVRVIVNEVEPDYWATGDKLKSET